MPDNGTSGSAVTEARRGSDPLWERLGKLRRWIGELRGWRRALAAWLLGAMAVLALPPFHLWFAVIPALTGLLWLIEGRPRLVSGLVTGWIFGLGYFMAGLYWIANALLTRAEQFGWMVPFAITGLSALMAGFIAMATAATVVSRLRGVNRVIFFAATWAAFEWVRGWMFTGFPWNPIGSVWAFSEPMIQVAAVVGTYGLGFLTILALGMPSILGEQSRLPARGYATVAASAIILAAVWIGGDIRLSFAGPTEHVPDVWLRLVQPNFAQTEKWRRDRLEHILESQIGMGQTPSDPPPTHVIWAETAAPLFLAADPLWRQRIGQGTPLGGLTITGTLRRSPADESLKLWNSLVVLDDSGKVVATYDKSHLVPFGEYVPFRDLLNVAKVTTGTTDFSFGAGRTTLALAGLPPVSPLICYEIIFPGDVVDRNRRPEWILNVTNDAWYGISTGPYQHFSAARLRAVEEGLPVVRVANTGISGIVDGYGRVVASLGLGRRGVVDGPLPRALERPPPYARWGNQILLLVVVLSAIAALLTSRRR